MIVIDPILHIDGLTKRFGSLPVLQHVSVAIARGRVTAILGPNGAGKTTLNATRPNEAGCWLDRARRPTECFDGNHAGSQ